jgi:hypothetical protein
MTEEVSTDRISPILGAIADLDQSDLDAIDQKIGALRAAQEALLQLRSLITTRWQQPPSAHHAVLSSPVEAANNGSSKPATKRKAEPVHRYDKEALEAWRIQVAGYLRKHGPTKPNLLLANLDIHQLALTHVMECNYFEQEPDGWHLTAEGRNALSVATGGD